MFPIILDTGASVSISPIKEDFIGGIHELENETIRGFAHDLKISGYGRVRWKLKDVFNNEMVVETNALYIPEGDVRLFSPQAWFQENQKGTLLVDASAATIYSPFDNSICTFFHHRDNNLPMAFQDPQYEFGLEFGSFTSTDVKLSVADEMNQNLTKAQKELLLWHWKLGHAGFT